MAVKDFRKTPDGTVINKNKDSFLRAKRMKMQSQAASEKIDRLEKRIDNQEALLEKILASLAVLNKK